MKYHLSRPPGPLGFLLLLGLLSFGANGHAATFTVDSTDDAVISACSSASNDCTLRGAVTASNTNAGADTINFDGTVFAASGPHVIALVTALPHLTGNVTITGPGADLMAVKEAGTKHLLSIFAVDSGVSVTLTGLTISNASNALYNAGTLTTTGCTLSGNRAGILNKGGTATVTNCTVNDNTEGGIDNYAVLTAINCTLSGNSGTNSGTNSEGIANYGALTAINCTLNGNDLGIYNQTGTVTATNCTLSGNFKGGITNAGTGIVNAGTLTATNCTLSGNSNYGIDNHGTLTATNCTVSGNAAAGIRNSFDTVTLTNCTLSGNTKGGIVNDNSTVILTNCTVSGNTAAGIDNGTYDPAKVTATNCTLSGNVYGINNHLASNAVTLKNTLVAGNMTNVVGAFTNGGHNITSGTAAQAGLQVDGSGNPVLAKNGGPTKTIQLLPGSPAIDRGGSGSPSTDQRGQKRPYDDPAIINATGGDGSDIGAFELFIPAVSVNNPRSLPEGSASSPGSITFDITLSGASTQSVTVNYQTRDGINNPATAGVDYVEKHGKLTFAPGETLKRVTVNFIGDDKAESKETFFLDLNTPTNATIADSRGVGTIVNDDATPALQFENDEPSQ